MLDSHTPEVRVRKTVCLRKGKTVQMKKYSVYLVVAMALAFASAGVVQADQVFNTPTGATNPLTGQPVSATADFNLSGNTLTVTLTNLTPKMVSAGQLLTGLTFTLSNGSGVSLTNQTGNLVDVGTGGVISNLGGTVDALGWGFGPTGGSTFELCMICSGGVSSLVTPSEGLLGPTSADGKFDSANSSIDGNTPHNPFVLGTATYTFTVPSNVTASDVVFTFGTQTGGNVSAPEPSSVLLLGLGLVGLPLVMRRRS